MTFEQFPNAIERILSRRGFVDEHGAEIAKELREKLKKEHKLDFRTDTPLPDWAIEIFRDSRFGGYKTRINIVMAHQFDITDTNPSKIFVPRQDVHSAPPKPPPEWLVEHRERKAEVAKKLLDKYK